ncbi:MAG: ABC transporter permease, partial [Trueperaceae bacterium]
MKVFWSRFSRNRGAVIGLVILGVVIACAIAAPVLFPQSPWSMVQRPFLPPFEMEGLPLGTDAVGRDVLSGLFHGARVSLLVGLVSTAVALVIGIPIGALAGYYGG